ncbi:MAG TPA: deoxyribodipyrimidine photo-lyase [Caulobacteraceae bacterium]|nr:deoxyribodipyrimidine photo-lyase [Caulobacteraceae bacterium]
MNAVSASAPPVLLWFRQDLRLSDNPAVDAAATSGRPVIPLFILHDASDGRPWGAASLWWLDKSLQALDADLRARGSRLILRRGDPAMIIPALAQDLGAKVMWNRLYGQAAVMRDSDLKRELHAASFNASLLVEPWQVKTGSGGAFQVFTPFWRAAQAAIADTDGLAAPRRIQAPAQWPGSDLLADWRLHPSGPDWSERFEGTPGEAGAGQALSAFIAGKLDGYADGRDRPDMQATSRLSAHLHWGEIGPRQVRAAVLAAVSNGASAEQGEKVLAELGWREFNHHLLYQHGALYQRNIRRDFDRFPWRSDPAALAAWREGRTGYPIVDAGMRQLWATGYMHNRVRMIVASFLIKHLLIDWREGEAWFWDTLTDACAANNPANWQWSAGSGADAAPFFRVFNPVMQGERFDPNGDYVRRWIPELGALPAKIIHRPWEAEPSGYPRPLVEHKDARARALEAFNAMRAI